MTAFCSLHDAGYYDIGGHDLIKYQFIHANCERNEHCNCREWRKTDATNYCISVLLLKARTRCVGVFGSDLVLTFSVRNPPEKVTIKYTSPMKFLYLTLSTNFVVYYIVIVSDGCRMENGSRPPRLHCDRALYPAKNRIPSTAYENQICGNH